MAAKEVVSTEATAPVMVKLEVNGEIYDPPRKIRTGDEVELTPFIQLQIDSGLARII